jgi:hypothetical protein
VKLYRFKQKNKSVKVLKLTHVEPFSETAAANYLKKKEKDKLFSIAVKETRKRLKKHQDAIVK